MERKRISKEQRMEVYNKFDGHCAYCGREIEYKDMQVDHMKPLRLGGADDMSNYMPACRLCNHYKRGNSLEGFRELIETIPGKLMRDSYICRVASAYNRIMFRYHPLEFYFEKKQEG